MSSLSVKSTPSGFFAVFRGGNRISQTFIDYGRAVHEMDKFRDEDGPRPRKCMCCNEMILSDGPGHRMCKTHRSKQSDLMMNDQLLGGW